MEDNVKNDKLKNQKELFIELLNSVNREGITDLLNNLDSVGFFESPASAKYHSSYEGGLLSHSMNVYFNLVKLNDGSYDNDTLIVVALLHDVCKAGTYIKDFKNVKGADGTWNKELFYKIEDKEPLGHGEKSVILLQKYINLTEDEITAIRWHMGGFESKDNYGYLNRAFSSCRLAVLLHMADLKATYLDEILESN